MKDTVDIHYPSIEMVCGSKISCVAWSAFHQSTLASSDYDHTVIVWDAATATKVCFFNYFSKGQIISECPFEILDFPKIPRKI